jgi:two-component system sensor histidine kinase MprB
MSFRLRLTLLTALAVAVAIVGTSFVVYYTDRSELMRQVDDDLRSSEALPPINAVLAGGGRWINVGAKPGNTFIASGGPGLTVRRKEFVLPKSAAAVQVSVFARSGAPPPSGPVRFSTQSFKGVPMRVLTLTTPLATVQVSRSLADVNRNLSHLRFLLVLVCVGGIGVAALLGALVSRRAVAPLRRLTETTDRIVETGDLSERIG